MTTGVLIPTFNNEPFIGNLLNKLSEVQNLEKILVIDSSSTDRTAEIVRKSGADIHIIQPNEFNHGATRELGRKKLATDIVIMMTADALPVNDQCINVLIEPIKQGISVVTYARQIPRKEADIFEAFPRQFNYPATSHTRSIEDVHKYGVYTFFCSNSCAAYLNSALDEINGFKPVLTNEDYFTVAQLLQSGHTISYVAEALVEHSHSYSAWQEFKRYFDTGYVRAEHKEINKIAGHAEGRGMHMITEMGAAVTKNDKLLLPRFVWISLLKWLGFRIGYFFYGMPGWINKRLSSQPYYWDSKYFTSSKIEQVK